MKWWRPRLNSMDEQTRPSQKLNNSIGDWKQSDLRLFWHAFSRQKQPVRIFLPYLLSYESRGGKMASLEGDEFNNDVPPAARHLLSANWRCTSNACSLQDTGKLYSEQPHTKSSCCLNPVWWFLHTCGGMDVRLCNIQIGSIFADHMDIG